ncbi:RbsD/FucU transport protein family protein [Cricetibacter osteomyelitidis]|uniref:D-ribose pyranase n=1 Tax=Cricetibacter osteomyelitidis TaxID=1521931 RepID=A0A4R2SPP9_9PAST|nr:RbsD/FucU transport protein family protein [Cricetibacter osteomyelitidis]
MTDRFLQTFDAVLAEEIKEKNPEIYTALLTRLSLLEQEQDNHIIIDYVPHTEFKLQTINNKAIIRSGECSPYANIILYSGVPF